MKKINISILIITLVCSFITIMGELDRGLVIVLKDQTILFAEEYEVSIAKAYQRLLDSVNKTRKVRS